MLTSQSGGRHFGSAASFLFAVAIGLQSVATVVADPAKRAPLKPTHKPAPKSEAKYAPDEGVQLRSAAMPIEKTPRNVQGRPSSPAAIEIPVTIDTNDSWDAGGDASNDVLMIDVADLGGLGSGNPATVTGIGWDLTIDTQNAPVGASWLSEAAILFDENVTPPSINAIALRPGFGNNVVGVMAFSSGGIVDFSDNLLPDIFLPDGILRIEFYETFDDANDVIDGLYNAPSTLTIALLDASSGACCEDATGTCVGTTDEATCVGVAGQTWFAGEDCASFACPPPPADYVMDNNPVSTCTGTFADSGGTGGPYANNENFTKTFTPDTGGVSLQFDFTFFNVESGFDFLTVYNGNTTGAPVIGVFDNANPPGTITSTAGDGSLTFRFTSDSSVALAGWVADISCVTPPSGGACCDEFGGCTEVADEAACPDTYLGTGSDCTPNVCPLPGDSCVSPIVVNLGTDLPYVDAGQTTCGRGNNYSATCLGSYDGGEDIMYELVVPSDTCIDLVMTSNSEWTGIALDDSCPPDGTCLDFATSSATDESLLTQMLSTGTYYVMLDTWPAPNCIDSFTLSITACPAGGACCHTDESCDDVVGAGNCIGMGDVYFDATSCANITCPPANDLCDNAASINAVPYQDLDVAVSGATDDANVNPSCDSGSSCGAGPANNGVWYTYTPSVSCAATIDQIGIDAATSVWTGSDCDSLTQITCSDPDPFTVSLAAGNTYWILVSNWSCSSEPTVDLDFAFDCDPLPSGACCVQDSGSCLCTEVPEIDCAGTYRGDNTSCNDMPDPCDCNENGICDDADLQPGVAAVFSASGLALAIPDELAPGIEHVINVPTSGTIQDLNVSVQITHSWVGDLCVSLTHPSGSPTVDLIQRSGGDLPCDATGCCGCGADDYDVVLDDTGAGGSIESLCAATAAPVPTSPPSYQPVGSLSAFNGLEMAGDWTISINDNFSGDTGALDGWSLQFNAVPPTSDDCNGNGTPDECEADCNENGVPDDCDVDVTDPDGDGIVSPDCNGNGLPDACDVPPIGSGPDCQGDGIPDECQLHTAMGLGAIVADGSFEAGSPNPFWTEASTNFGTTLCTTGLCGTGGGTAGPRTGSWWSWFGGIGAAETGSVEQTVTIPSGVDTLEFYLWIGAASGNGTDFLRVRIDGTIVFSVMENAPGFGAYAPVLVDISAFANGGSHLLRIESTVNGPAVTNFNVDDIAILEPTGPPVNDCNINGVPDECDAPVCGNECLEGGEAGTTAEECDGSFDDACPGACYPSGSAFECRCPFCGDGAVGSGEACDGGVCCTSSCSFNTGTVCRASTGACDPAESCGGSSAGCPPDVMITSCANNDGCCPAGCTVNNDSDCAAVCGNNKAESAEVCDGTDDDECPGECRVDCTCPEPDPEDPVPTVSQWGLVLMVLILLIGARVYFGRRQEGTPGAV